MLLLLLYIISKEKVGIVCSAMFLMSVASECVHVLPLIRLTHTLSIPLSFLLSLFSNNHHHHHLHTRPYNPSPSWHITSNT